MTSGRASCATAHMSSSCWRIMSLDSRHALIFPRSDRSARRISGDWASAWMSTDSGAARAPAAAIIASNPREVETVTSCPRPFSADASAAKG